MHVKPQFLVKSQTNRYILWQTLTF